MKRGRDASLCLGLGSSHWTFGLEAERSTTRDMELWATNAYAT